MVPNLAHKHHAYARYFLPKSNRFEPTGVRVGAKAIQECLVAHELIVVWSFGTLSLSELCWKSDRHNSEESLAILMAEQGLLSKPNLYVIALLRLMRDQLSSTEVALRSLTKSRLSTRKRPKSKRVPPHQLEPEPDFNRTPLEVG